MSACGSVAVFSPHSVRRRRSFIAISLLSRPVLIRQLCQLKRNKFVSKARRALPAIGSGKRSYHFAIQFRPQIISSQFCVETTLIGKCARESWICMQIASCAAINGALHTRRASFDSPSAAGNARQMPTRCPSRLFRYERPH